MAKLNDHPAVKRAREANRRPAAPAVLDAVKLRALCRDAGADDVGFVEVERLPGERVHAEAALPGARTLVALVKRLNREPIRSPARSVANLEFHHTGDAVNEVARRIVGRLEADGVRALSPSMGFPMEMDNFPGRLWVIAHKTVAVEAGLGRIGIHRNVIHPKFGNFILLGTVVIDAEVSAYDRPVDYNPCLECKLCVAACPVGAIGADGHFDFNACYTHNYREFMGGFTTWAETVADSGSAREYRRRVTDPESVSLWQSLSFGANYKAAYCMAVCPAGDDVIAPWLEDRKGHLDTVVRPLQAKAEPVYVVPGSDAEAHAARRYPHKTLRRVPNSLRPTSIAGFLSGLPLVFQRGAAGDLDATFHFTFTGDEQARATVVIRAGTVAVRDGHHGEADVAVRADAAAWLGYVRRDHGLLGPLLRRRIRVKGSPRLLLRFGRCFPG